MIEKMAINQVSSSDPVYGDRSSVASHLFSHFELPAGMLGFLYDHLLYLSYST